MAGGIYYMVSCDWCGVQAEEEVYRYTSRQDALAVRKRITRYDGWLLKRPGGLDTVLLCPECVAEDR